MDRQKERSFCTDVSWQGRGACRRCNIRHLMTSSGLPETSFTAVLGPIENSQYSGGTVLFKEGECGRSLYSIRSGIIKVLSLSSDGTERIVRLLGAGSVLGLELMEAGVCYRHTAITLTPVDACCIPLATMLQLDAGYPQLCQEIRARLQEDLNRVDEWIVNLGTGAARKRIAHLLLLMIEYGNHPDGGIDLLGREDMGAIIGSSMETASRIIADLKRRNILRKTGKNRYQCDSTALLAITRETG